MGIVENFMKSTTIYNKYKINKTARKNKKLDAVDGKRMQFYAQFVRHGTTCFDIGANIGNRTKIFLEIVGSKGKVVAVEPQDFCCKILQRSFSNQSNFFLEKKALGATSGDAEIFISNETTVSTMSEEWIKKARKSKRFGEETEWTKSEKITVSTLDSLLGKYGVPSFIKIDVEGYEREVISGLSKPIQTCFSLEFVPEFLASTFDCLNLLSSLGKIECNYSLNETMTLSLNTWVSPHEIKGILSSYKESNDNSLFGDVYVRLNM